MKPNPSSFLSPTLFILLCISLKKKTLIFLDSKFRIEPTFSGWERQSETGTRKLQQWAIFFFLSWVWWVIGIIIMYQPLNVCCLYSLGYRKYIIVMKNRSSQSNSYDQADVHLGLFVQLSLFLLPNPHFSVTPIPFSQLLSLCVSQSCISTCYFLPLPPLPFWLCVPFLQNLLLFLPRTRASVRRAGLAEQAVRLVLDQSFTLRLSTCSLNPQMFSHLFKTVNYLTFYIKDLRVLVIRIE